MPSGIAEKTTTSLSQEVSDLLDSGTFQQARYMLNRLPAADTAHLIECSPPDSRGILWSLLDEDNRSEVLACLSDELQGQFAATMDLKELAALSADIETDDLVDTARILTELGMTILATRGTASFLKEHGITSNVVNKAYEGGRSIVDVIKDGGVQLVLNTTEGAQAVEDSRSMRSVTLNDKIPYFTTAAGGIAAVAAIKSRDEGEVGVRSLQA